MALLHDVREDYDVADSEIRELFGDLVANAVDAMTKTFRGQRRNDETLFERIATDPIASVVKPADRITNQNSMVGMSTPAKMVAYATETRTLYPPMIKDGGTDVPRPGTGVRGEQAGAVQPAEPAGRHPGGPFLTSPVGGVRYGVSVLFDGRWSLERLRARPADVRTLPLPRWEGHS